MTNTDRWYVTGKLGDRVTCADEHDARKYAAQCDVKYPQNAPHVATQMLMVGDDDQASTVELRAQVLRLRVALLHCKSLAERMRGGMRWSWENKDAEAISDTVDDALSETE